MQNPKILEVNRFIVKDQSGEDINVVEAKLQGLVEYYRYKYQKGRSIIGSTVPHQWWREVKREPVPESEWDTISIVRANLPNDIEEQQEPF